MSDSTPRLHCEVFRVLSGADRDAVWVLQNEMFALEMAESPLHLTYTEEEFDVAVSDPGVLKLLFRPAGAAAGQVDAVVFLALDLRSSEWVSPQFVDRWLGVDASRRGAYLALLAIRDSSLQSLMAVMDGVYAVMAEEGRERLLLDTDDRRFRQWQIAAIRRYSRYCSAPDVKALGRYTFGAVYLDGHPLDTPPIDVSYTE